MEHQTIVLFHLQIQAVRLIRLQPIIPIIQQTVVQVVIVVLISSIIIIRHLVLVNHLALDNRHKHRLHSNFHLLETSNQTHLLCFLLHIKIYAIKFLLTTIFANFDIHSTKIDILFIFIYSSYLFTNQSINCYILSCFSLMHGYKLKHEQYEEKRKKEL
jgi:ABC-type protease/lipase transport system fused ATPase/permease subunit